MQIEAAIGAFLAEFSQFETHGLKRLLRALSKDDALVAQAESLLGLEARLILLERLAFARAIPGELMTQLMALLSRTRTLRDQRDALARTLDSILPAETAATSAPSLAQIEAHVTEATEVQHLFLMVASKVDSHLAHPLQSEPRLLS